MNVSVFGSVVASEVDGPGFRAVVHLAGCTLRCPGCFNQDMWDAHGPGTRQIPVKTLAAELLSVSPAVTISGGEPTDQLVQILGLLRVLRTLGCHDVVMFSGRRLGALRRLPVWQAIEAEGLLDVLIDGRFRADLIETEQVLRGSTNQRIHCLTGIYEPQDFHSRGVQLHADGGRLVVTGFPSSELTEAL